jgi:hypothetical protein
VKEIAFTVVHPYGCKITIEDFADKRCPPESAYIIPKGYRVKTVYDLESEIVRQQKRYDNLLNGLVYWKLKALGLWRTP